MIESFPIGVAQKTQVSVVSPKFARIFADTLPVHVRICLRRGGIRAFFLEQRTLQTMTANVGWVQEGETLDLSFHGCVDFRVAKQVCGICAQIRPDLKYCVVDLNHVTRIFDSGLALLEMLYLRLKETGARMVFLVDDLDIRGRLALILPVIYLWSTSGG